MIVRYTDQVLSSEGFLLASPDTVLAVAKQNRLNLSSESLLISACLCWAEVEVARNEELTFDTTGLRNALGTIFQHLRFYSLKADELVKVLADTKVLTAIEKWSLIVDVTNKEFSDIPKGFCKIFKARVKPDSIPIPKFITYTEATNGPKQCKSCSRTWKENGYCSYCNSSSQKQNLLHVAVTFQVESDVFFVGVTFFKPFTTNPIFCLFDASGEVLDTGKIFIGEDRKSIRVEHAVMLNAHTKYFLIIHSNKEKCEIEIGQETFPTVTGNEFQEINFAQNPNKGFVTSIMFKIA
jgi:hypothetical protein